MKKLIILCSAVLGSLLFCGCLPSSAPYEDFYSRSFVLRYCQVSDISIERRYYSEDDPDYNLGYFIRVVSDKLYRAILSSQVFLLFYGLGDMEHCRLGCRSSGGNAAR